MKKSSNIVFRPEKPLIAAIDHLRKRKKETRTKTLELAMACLLAKDLLEDPEKPFDPRDVVDSEPWVVAMLYIAKHQPGGYERLWPMKNEAGEIYGWFPHARDMAAAQKHV